MPIRNLEALASNLALEWDLNEAEHDDLLAFGSTLAMCDCLAETVHVHMEMRAEVLKMVGTEVQELYDAMTEWKGGLA